MKINVLTHPEYQQRLFTWHKWRLTYASGDDFVANYLIRASQRESTEDFKNRMAITYVPAFAKAAINDIKNAIFQRICDVTRTGGHASYAKAVKGQNGGVDRLGSSMNTFIGDNVLPELLSMQRVGIYVDMPPKTGKEMAIDNVLPYIYIYRTEQIRSWSMSEPGNKSMFKSVLLQEEVDKIDKLTGLPEGKEVRYRLVYLTEINGQQRVAVKFYRADGEPSTLPMILDLEIIPFTIAKLNCALLEDAANYQIAHLNMASSDMMYALKSNYPFYTEQYDPRASSKHTKLPPAAENPVDANQISAEPVDKQKQVVETGPSAGRMYPLGTERPDFIHPSPEPLRASMAKQEDLKKEVRLMVNLALSNLSSATSSVDSKSFDERGLEAGLSYIGLVLERAENQIALFWNEYFEGTHEEAVVKYPSKYNLKTDDEIQKENEHNKDMALTVNSLDFKRHMAVRLVETTIGSRITAAEFERIQESLMKSDSPLVDYKTLVKDVEAGVLAAGDCAEMKNFPRGTADRAQAEHADRLARILESQTKGNAARGNPDGDDNPAGNAKDEKTASQDTTQGGKTRGDA